MGTVARIPENSWYYVSCGWIINIMFFLLLASQLEIKKGLQEDWQLIVTCALSQLEGVCRKIQSGNVTIKELEHIESKQGQMNKLCEAVGSTMASVSLTQASELQGNIAQRLKEYAHFTEYTSRLEHFLNHIGEVVTGEWDHQLYMHIFIILLLGQPELLRMLQRDFREEKINCLCQKLPNDSGYQVMCFPTAKPIEPYLERFYTISYTHSNDLFNRFWQERLSEVRKDIGMLQFTQVNEFLWKPVFDRCVKLLDDLHSGKLKLSAVDTLFKANYSSNQKRLYLDLKKLHIGVGICTGKSTSNFIWVKTVVEQMGQYWDLCNYQEAAQAFIKIRDTLGLTGDFRLVERVAKHVRNI